MSEIKNIVLTVDQADKIYAEAFELLRRVDSGEFLSDIPTTRQEIACARLLYQLSKPEKCNSEPHVKLVDGCQVDNSPVVKELKTIFPNNLPAMGKRGNRLY